MKKFLFVLCIFLSACTFPKDPENSYEEAKQSALQVGLVENPPYVITLEEQPSGSEVEMIREFATKAGLQVKFFKGSESELISKLHKFKLHIVAGGFDKNTVWSKKAGLTTTYDKQHVFLIPKGENQLLKNIEEYILSKRNRDEQY
jgi:membrane-bound lytic murein transglycosylase MltF